MFLGVVVGVVSFLVVFGRRMGVVLVVVSFLVVFGRFWASYGASLCFGRFGSLLGVVWGVVLFWSFLVAFDAVDAFSWRDRLAIEPK